MTSFFIVPSFVPPTLEQLPTEPDDVTIICRQEAKITQEVGGGRESGAGFKGGAALCTAHDHSLSPHSCSRCASTTATRSPWVW